jgi:hypothetical protein
VTLEVRLNIDEVTSNGKKLKSRFCAVEKWTLFVELLSFHEQASDQSGIIMEGSTLTLVCIHGRIIQLLYMPVVGQLLQESEITSCVHSTIALQ